MCVSLAVRQQDPWLQCSRLIDFGQWRGQRGSPGAGPAWLIPSGFLFKCTFSDLTPDTGQQLGVRCGPWLRGPGVHSTQGHDMP